MANNSHSNQLVVVYSDNRMHSNLQLVDCLVVKLNKYRAQLELCSGSGAGQHRILGVYLVQSLQLWEVACSELTQHLLELELVVVSLGVHSPSQQLADSSVEAQVLQVVEDSSEVVVHNNQQEEVDSLETNQPCKSQLVEVYLELQLLLQVVASLDRSSNLVVEVYLDNLKTHNNKQEDYLVSLLNHPVVYLEPNSNSNSPNTEA